MTKPETTLPEIPVGFFYKNMGESCKRDGWIVHLAKIVQSDSVFGSKTVILYGQGKTIQQAVDDALKNKEIAP